MSSQRILAALTAATLIAIPAEGLRQKAYYDPPGILTVCYGHTGNVSKYKTYSLNECKALLNKDMLDAIQAVDSCRPSLPIPILAAFSDATYNLGPKIACDTERSTAARYLKEGKYREACNELPRWNKAVIAGNLVELPGLTKRRRTEQELCLTGISK